MRHFLSILIIFTTSGILHAQYKLDDGFSIEFPDHLEVFDSIDPADNVKYAMAEDWEESFICQVSMDEIIYQAIDTPEKSMNTLRFAASNNILDMKVNAGFSLKDSTLITQDGYFGYKLRYKMEGFEGHAEARIYLVNNHIYSAFYFGNPDNPEHRNSFFNSISIHAKPMDPTPDKPEEKRGKSAYELGKSIGYILFPLVLIIVGVVVRNKRKKNVENF